MCLNCEWEELLEEIDELLEDSKYEFAQDTLEGIKEWVSEKEHCADGQKDAVANIRDCK